MSEGSGTQSASGLSDQQFNQYAGIAFIVIGLLGPLLVLFSPVLAPIFATMGLPKLAVAKGGTGIGDAIRFGWYTLPLSLIHI